MKLGITTARNGRALSPTPPCFQRFHCRASVQGWAGGRNHTSASYARGREVTVAGVQRCQLSRAADCRPRINGASLPLRPLALCYSSRLTVADVMCRHDEIRSSAGLSPTAGMKEEHLVLIRTRAQSWWYKSVLVVCSGLISVFLSSSDCFGLQRGCN